MKQLKYHRVKKNFEPFCYFEKARKAQFFNHQILLFNIINIATWKEIHQLNPELLPYKTSSKLAFCKTFTNYGEIHLFLKLIRTMEQNNHLLKYFK